MNASPTGVVYVVDDDDGIRNALASLLRSVGWQVLLFSTPAAFLASDRPDLPGCLLLDVRLPGESGLVFHDQMVKANLSVPVIFMSGHGDVTMSVRAMKAGAVDFLAKPFRDQDMLDAITLALTRDTENRAARDISDALLARYRTLTSRQREIMALVVSGLMNKQIASSVNLSEITVKIHRRGVMEKMGVRSLADLVRAASLIDKGPR